MAQRTLCDVCGRVCGSCKRLSVKIHESNTDLLEKLSAFETDNYQEHATVVKTFDLCRSCTEKIVTVMLENHKPIRVGE